MFKSTLGCALLVLGFCWIGLGQPPRERKIDRSASEEKFSDTLPENVADFVRRWGEDRSIDDLSTDDLESLRAPIANTQNVLDALRPKSAFVSFDSLVVIKTNDEPSDSDPRLIAGSTVELEDGTTVELGTVLAVGQVIRRGVLLNPDATPVVLENVETGENYLLGQGGVAAGGCATSCGVSCGAGYYGCCNGGACAKCNCAEGNSSVPCDSGGPGSNGCQLSVVQ